MSVEIGELRARLVAEATQMKQEVQAVKKGFVDLGEEGKKASVALQGVSAAINNVGKAKGLDELPSALDNLNARIHLQRKRLAELKEAFDATFNQEKKNQIQEQMLKTEATIIRMTASSNQMALKMDEAEKALSQTGEAASQAADKVVSFDQSLKDIGLSAEQIKVVKRNLDGIDPAKAERQLEELNITLKKLGVSSDNIEKINRELRETEVESGKAGRGINALASGIASFGAGAAMSKIINLTRTLANEANQLASSYRGLSVVAKSFNVDTGEAADLADKLADRWGLSKGVLADTVKTYTTLNFSLEETERIITATADAAAYNRQAHLSWEDAIKQVAEGIKAGNSNLTDAAGITTNLSVMQDRYAKSIGTTAAKLTEAQKVQAAYYGMLEEGAIFAGNADDAMTGFTGTQASFQSTIQEARTVLGEAFIPSLERILELITPLIKGFATWAEGNKDTVVGLTAAAVAVTALIAVVGALAAAFITLNAAMGPIGWIALGIGAVIAGVSAYAIATNQASEAAQSFAANQEQLNKALSESPIKLTAQEYKMMQSNMEQLNELLEERNRLEQEYAALSAKQNDASITADELKRLFEVGKALGEINKEMEGMGYSNVEQAAFALRNMQKASEEALGAKVALVRENMREQITHADNVSELKTLSSEYDKLEKATNLTEQQKARLTEVVKKLKQEYPALQTELDTENKWHIKNREALDGYITGEENRVNAAIAAAKATIQAAKTEAEERVRLARESMAEIERLEGNAKTSSPAPFVSDQIGDFMSSQLSDAIDETKKRLTDQISKGNYDINEAAKLLDDLTIGIDAFRTPVTAGTTDDKKKKTGKVKTKAELEREQYQEALKLIEYKRNMDLLTEQQEIDSLEKLRKKYEHNAEIRMELEVRIHQIKKQLAADEEKRLEEEAKKTEKAARERFDKSAEWITQEERRMVLAGESEEAISKMKMEAWTRVRARYDKDSEYYKQADTQLYNLRVDVIKKQAKAEQDAVKEREKLQKDATKKALDAIDKAKKAELDALNDRRKALQKFYDDQKRVIDDSERLKERNDIMAEMELYRYASSEKGQKHFLELQEKLRKMDVEQQKRDLDDERDQKLEAIDKQKQDIEDYYSDLREATSDLTGDLTALYKLADDERLKSFVETNELIKQEMANLQAALAASQVAAAATASTGILDAVVAQMQANSIAWHSADAAGRKRLSADNKALGDQIGATYNSQDGRWYKDNVPLYHTGGIAGEMNFRSPYELAPDEISAILRRGEPVLTKDQVGSLVSAQAGGAQINIEKFIEVNEPVFEDGIDMRAFGREAGNEAADILRKQLAGGG